MNWRKWLVWLWLSILPLFYFNCSKMGSPVQIPGGSISNSNGGLIGATSNLPSFVVNNDGSVQVYEDKELNYSPSGGVNGSYTASGLPSWMTVDSTTGTLIGVPHQLSSAATVTLTDSASGKAYGPITISVVGDPLKEQQWHLLNLGQNSFAKVAGIAGEDIHDSESIKNNLLGTGVTIAISDTGVVTSHPDLSPNLLAGQSRNYMNNYSVTRSWLGDPTPSAADPENGHGTAVAGLAAAKGWNGIGGRGVAPEANFAAFLFLPAQDILVQRGLFDMALYDQFAGSFDIYNYSWGDPQCFLLEYPADYTSKLLSGVTSGRGGLGNVYVMAAGNSYVEDITDCYTNATSSSVLGNTNFSEATTTPYTINVGAVNADGVSSSYSSPGSAVWISATGGEFGLQTPDANASPLDGEPALVTTDYPGCQNGIKTFYTAQSAFDAGTDAGNKDCLYASTMNGTSGATPVVSGAIAQLLQANPNLSWRDIKYILAKTADKVDPNSNPINHPSTALNLAGHDYELPWITNSAGFHFHDYYGFGRINVDNAVSLARNYVSSLGTLKNLNWKYDSGALTAAIPDDSATGLTETFNVTDALSIEAVQLRVSIGSCVSDIGLELTSPSGTKSILMNINSLLQDTSINDHIFLSNAFFGEPSAGTWTLRVIDGHATCTAQLTNWKLNFLGH